MEAEGWTQTQHRYRSRGLKQRKPNEAALLSSAWHKVHSCRSAALPITPNLLGMRSCGGRQPFVSFFPAMVSLS